MITDFELAHPELWHLLWLVVAALALAAWGVARRRQVLASFGVDASKFRDWISACSRRRWLRATVLSLALVLLGGAALQPRCNPEKKRFKTIARDVAVLVDVSRSMLARDLKPNRLERAKLELERLSDRLQGDRIGLIAFSGNAVVECPLTSNYSYFKSVVRNLGPRSASQGGTRMGDAIRKALQNLLGVEAKRDRGGDRTERPRRGESQTEAEARGPRERTYADILLITDGEDHDSYPIKAAEQAAADDVGLYIVGLGSEEGSPIPVEKEGGGTGYLRYKGKTVLSKLDSKTLMEMINAAARGSYLPAGTDNFDLVDLWEKHIRSQQGRDVYEENVSWTEIFQPFLLAGLLLLALFLLIPERPGRQAAVDWLETSS